MRDYIHIVDLCHAHLAALRQLPGIIGSRACNLGNGKGFSVQEVIAAAERVTGNRISLMDAPRQAGDPAVLVADATLAKAELGWKPQYPDIDTIIY